MNDTIKIVLVDDHVLLRNGLASLVADLGYTVLYECSNGKELVEKVTTRDQPDLVLMDISMQVMNGFETTLWLRQNCPWINVLALSVSNDENSIIKMIKCGAKGYLLKDCSPRELQQAIESVVHKGFYYSDLVSGKLIHSLQGEDDEEENERDIAHNLNPREILFLKLAATEKTYKEIAAQMFVSPRTVDGYRDDLFEKLHVKCRVGLVLFAIKNKIVML